MKINQDILSRYAEGKCSTEEQRLVEAWFDQYEREDAFLDEELETAIANLDERVLPQAKVRSLWKWSAAVAAVALVCFTFYFVGKKDSGNFPKFTSLADIKAPVSSNAFLVLEDDASYPLDDIKVGDTVHLLGYDLTRSATGALQYVGIPNSDRQVYHKLRTNNGGFAAVELADGSKVWINAASELAYPIAFSSMREVNLKGEGYFEVNKVLEAGVKKPFLVRGSEQTIEVLGTKFNANFTDGHETALLEGAVRLANQGSVFGETLSDDVVSVLMKPGQVYTNEQLLEVDDIDRYMDWKAGYFDLRRLNIYDLAAELTKWYNVKIEVEEGLSKDVLFGRIDKQQDLQQVLKLVEKVIPITYELKNNTLVISGSKAG